MKDDIGINKQCRVMYARGNSPLRKLGMCCEKVKILLSTHYVSLYTSHLWWKHKKHLLISICCLR